MKPEKRYPLIVFDWDGTLMDSTAGITVSIQEAARDMGLPVPAREAASHIIGLGLHDSLRTAVPTLPAEKYMDFVELYRKHFHAQQESMALFPGVRELLGQLRSDGHRLAVATGKSRRGLDQALRAGDVLMIGDTSHDLGMAKSAGVDAVAVSYGAHPLEALRALAPRACVASVGELRQWLTTNG